MSRSRVSFIVAAVAGVVSTLTDSSRAECLLGRLLAPPGEAAAFDYFGSSVGLDGDRLVVGCQYDDGAYFNTGALFVFERTGTAWQPVVKLTATDGASFDVLGLSADVSGDRVAGGAPFDGRSLGDHQGAAYVFEYDGAQWDQHKLTSGAFSRAFEWFGTALDLEGDDLIVGAPGNQDPNLAMPGWAYAFRRDAGGWTLQQQLTPGDPDPNDLFGDAVALDGDLAIIGARGDDQEATEAGAAYVFRRSAGVWSQEAKLTADDAAAYDRFGWSVAVDSERAFVGSPGRQGASFNEGAVYEFHRVAGVWTQVQRITASDAFADDNFGNALAVDGDALLIGAWFSDNDASASGSVYAFRHDGAQWVESAKFVSTHDEMLGNFGVSIGLSNGLAVVGAPNENASPGPDSGAAYSFAVAGPDCNQNDSPDLCDIHVGASEDLNGNDVPDECEVCPLDLDGDGSVGLGDLSALLESFGCATGDACYSADRDFDGDGEVGLSDLSDLLADFGTDCP